MCVCVCVCVCVFERRLSSIDVSIVIYVSYPGRFSIVYTTITSVLTTRLIAMTTLAPSMRPNLLYQKERRTRKQFEKG